MHKPEDPDKMGRHEPKEYEDPDGLDNQNGPGETNGPNG